MAQDPAFLFYYQDFLVGTDDMDNDEVGAYIRCLCHQASKGCISEKHMMKICLRQEVYTTVSCKFQRNEAGNYCNERLLLEINKRKAFAESRRNNRMKKSSDIHMSKTSKTYVAHMENENENENEDVIEIEDANEVKTVRKKFMKPDENEVYNYMGELNTKGKNFMPDDRLTNFAREFIDYYEGNGWKIGKNAMKDWQSTARRWMRNEWDKIKNQKSYGKQSNSTADSVAKANQLYADAVAISRARNQAEQNQRAAEG